MGRCALRLCGLANLFPLNNCSVNNIWLKFAAIERTQMPTRDPLMLRALLRANHTQYKMSELANMCFMIEAPADEFLPFDGSPKDVETSKDKDDTSTSIAINQTSPAAFVIPDVDKYQMSHTSTLASCPLLYRQYPSPKLYLTKNLMATLNHWLCRKTLRSMRSLCSVFRRENLKDRARRRRKVIRSFH